MNKNAETNLILKQPSAWIPLVMSCLALAFVLGYVAIFGIVRQPDEGAPARIFQLLMVAELPFVAYFGFKWLPRQPKEALLVLALQAAAWIIPVVTILWLESL